MGYIGKKKIKNSRKNRVVAVLNTGEKFKTGKEKEEGPAKKKDHILSGLKPANWQGKEEGVLGGGNVQIERRQRRTHEWLPVNLGGTQKKKDLGKCS